MDLNIFIIKIINVTETILVIRRFGFDEIIIVYI